MEKIDINKKYQTKDGRSVRIYATDGDTINPIHGAMLCESGWISRSWAHTGEVGVGIPSNDNIIEVKEKKQIMENIDINKKYTNSLGDEITIHAINGPDIDYPVIASRCVEGEWSVTQYTSDGRHNLMIHVDNDLNLIELKEKKQLTGFMNVYEGSSVFTRHTSRYKADNAAWARSQKRIACIHLSKYNITYTEGEGL